MLEKKYGHRTNLFRRPTSFIDTPYAAFFALRWSRLSGLEARSRGLYGLE